MRKRIFEIVEIGKDNDKVSQAYDAFMFVAILVSLLPLATKSDAAIYTIIDRITATIFIIDYFLRLITADLKLKQGLLSFAKYPITFMALVDLISILPSLIPVNSSLKVLRLLRVGKTIKAIKVLKIFKTFRYSKNIMIIVEVFRREKDSLMVVCGLAITYVLISALVIFNIEPDTFETFFDAIYWAVVSLTTVGYGDVFCTSILGKVITMFSSIFGIAIVALPAGIITAGYMDIVNSNKK